MNKKESDTVENILHDFYDAISGQANDIPYLGMSPSGKMDQPTGASNIKVETISKKAYLLSMFEGIDPQEYAVKVFKKLTLEHIEILITPIKYCHKYGVAPSGQLIAAQLGMSYKYYRRRRSECRKDVLEVDKLFRPDAYLDDEVTQNVV